MTIRKASNFDSSLAEYTSASAASTARRSESTASSNSTTSTNSSRRLSRGAELALELRDAVTYGRELRRAHAMLKLTERARPPGPVSYKHRFASMAARMIALAWTAPINVPEPAHICPVDMTDAEREHEREALEHSALFAACKDHLPAKNLSAAMLSLENFGLEVENLANHCRQTGCEHCTAWLPTRLESGETHWLVVVVVPRHDGTTECHVVDTKPGDPASAKNIQMLCRQVQAQKGMRLLVQTLPSRTGQDSATLDGRFIKEVHQLVLPSNKTKRAEQFASAIDAPVLEQVKLAQTFLSVTFHSPFARVLGDMAEWTSLGKPAAAWIHSVDANGENRWVQLLAYADEEGHTHWNLLEDENDAANNIRDQLSARLRDCGVELDD